MRKKILLVTACFFLAISFLLGVGSASAYFKTKKTLQSLRVAKNKRVAKMLPTSYERPIVIVTASYNNEKYSTKHLESVLCQEYANYRVVYINDASKDRTAEIVSKYLKENDTGFHYQVIHNKKNKGAMANIYHAIHSCSDEEIVVILDGDDFFAHSKVLATINAAYENPNCWLTYGSYLEYPSYRKGEFAKPIDLKIERQRGIRKHAFWTSHLRTFYAKLFKSVKKEDFYYKGEFLQMSCDIAMMLPMLEMAMDHHYFIEDILCIYNRDNPICDDKKNGKKQISLEKFIRKKQSYSPIQKL